MATSAVVFCGLPGSGKSTLAKQIDNATIVETDDYFQRFGEYEHKESQLAKAHAWNLKRWIHLAENPYDKTIVCSNTNILICEISPYVEVANAFGLTVLVRRIEISLDTAIIRNTHCVPVQTLEEMFEDFQRAEYPEWWNVQVETNE